MKVIAVIAAAAVALVLAAAASASSFVKVGIQDDAWLEYGPGTLEERVQRIDALGVDLVRVTLRWDEIEPAKGTFRWERSDALLGALRAGGIAPVVTLYGTPSWANGGAGARAVPTRAGDFSHFAGAVARRYGHVRYWLIWNEPNQSRWLLPTTPRAYVSKLLNPAYRAIKAVRRSAKVGGGVTAPRGSRGGVSPVAWIRGMRAAGARLDAYAHHPYPLKPTDSPWTGGCDHCETISMSRLERLLRETGKAFPRARVWLTEYGYQTNPPDRTLGVSYAKQARYVGEAARRVYVAPRVDMLIHYLLRDEPDVDRWQSGLETVDGRAKPALRATMLPLTQLRRSGLKTVLWGQVRPGKGVQRYLLQRFHKGKWRTVGGARSTSSRGYLTRTLSAGRGTKVRLVHPATGTASPALRIS